MRQSATFTAVPGTLMQVRLQYQTGYVEILNDSNQLLNVTMNTGSMTILPCMGYLMPSPLGGTTISFSVSPLDGGVYLNADNGPANSVVVNEYLEGEIVPVGYPLLLNRSIAPQNNIVTSIVSTTVAASSSGLTLTAGVVASPNYLFLQGFDLDIDQESTAHAMSMNITGLKTGISPNTTPLTLNYIYHSQTNGSIRERVRFSQAISADTINTPIVLTVPAVTGGTARLAANLYTTSM